MELKQYMSALWKWKWLIVLATIIATLSSYWATARMPRVYRTTTTLMVGQAIQSTNPNTQDFRTSQQLAQTYVQLVRRQPILQATIETLQLTMPWPSLAEQVVGSIVAGTQLIQISVVDNDPQRAKTLADEIAREGPEHGQIDRSKLDAAGFSQEVADGLGIRRQRSLADDGVLRILHPVSGGPRVAAARQLCELLEGLLGELHQMVEVEGALSGDALGVALLVLHRAEHRRIVQIEQLRNAATALAEDQPLRRCR